MLPKLPRERLWCLLFVCASTLSAFDVSRTAHAEPQSRFPIRISANARHFEDQNGQPFLVRGDTAWSLPAQLTLDEATFYLRRRKAQGFNSVLITLVERKFSDHPPRNSAGVEPFGVPGDFSRPNEPYFVHVDALLHAAHRQNMLVFLTPAYLGWKGRDEGWFQQLVRLGPERVRRYGRFVGSRYKEFAHIVWVLGGDFTPPWRFRWVVDALADGIRDGGGRQLMTAHCGQESPATPFGNRTWLDFTNVYSYARDLYKVTIAEYQRKPVRPFVMIESIYEGEHHSRPERMRHQAYWSLLSGAAGHFFGNNPVWNFSSPAKVFPSELQWQQALDSRGAEDMSRVSMLFQTLRWNDLVPDITRRLVVDENRSGTDHPSATAITSDRTLAVTYFASMPPRRVVLDARSISMPFRAFWYDPTSGKTNPATVQAVDATGSTTIVSPGQNSAGAKDWVLILRTGTE